MDYTAEIPVSAEKNTPLEKSTCGSTSFRSAKSGATLQFLLPICRAEACAKGAFVSQTPVVLFEILNSMKPYSPVLHACIGKLRPAMVFFEPRQFDEASNRIPPTSRANSDASSRRNAGKRSESPRRHGVKILFINLCFCGEQQNLLF